MNTDYSAISFNSIETAICVEDTAEIAHTVKVSIPILMPMVKTGDVVNNTDLPVSVSNIKSKINTRSISPCNTVNYLELKLPPGVTNATKGDKFIVQFLDGEPNKPVLMRKL